MLARIAKSKIRQRLSRLLLQVLAITIVLALPRTGLAQPLLAGQGDAKPDCASPAGPRVNWSGCDLRQANLRGALLRSANLSNADLRGADLRRAILFHANLAGADLRDANLSKAMLDDADLRGANLTGAKLESATLADADLSEARGLPVITNARWADTRCPDQTECDQNGHTCHKHFVEEDSVTVAEPPQ